MNIEVPARIAHAAVREFFRCSEGACPPDWADLSPLEREAVIAAARAVRRGDWDRAWTELQGPFLSPLHRRLVEDNVFPEDAKPFERACFALFVHTVAFHPEVYTCS